MAILIDMAKWTWEVLMRTETTLQTESLPLRFIPCYKSGGGSTLSKLSSCKYSLFAELDSDGLPPLAYNGLQLTEGGDLTEKVT